MEKVEKIGVFAGSFDPFTIGHYNLILKVLPLFDRIIIALGENTDKTKTMFPLPQRMQWIEQALVSYPQVEVRTYKGLTVDFCNQVGARYLIRGIRNTLDFEYEKNIARINKELAPEIETIFIMPDAEEEVVSSTMLREMILHKKDVSKYLPTNINPNRSLESTLL